MKKYIILLLTVLLLCFVGCSESQAKKEILYGFEVDEVQEYLEGTFITVRAPFVYDETGNVYDVTSKVFDSKNVEVKVENSGFFAYDVNGYNIYYYAETNSGVQETKTTIRVLPRQNAVFDIDYSSIGVVGELYEFTLPADLMEQGEITFEATHVESGEKDICDLDGSFTPTHAGLYKVNIVVHESQGDLEGSFNVYMQKELQEGEVEVFDEEWSVKNKYLDVVDGRIAAGWSAKSTEVTNVKNRFNKDDTLLTLTTNADYSEFYFMPREEKMYYQSLIEKGYSYVSVWVKIEATKAPKVQRRLGYTWEYHDYVTYNLGEWFEIQYPLTGDTNTFITMFEDYRMRWLPAIVFDNYNAKDIIKIYIDDITAVKMEKGEVELFDEKWSENVRDTDKRLVDGWEVKSTDETAVKNRFNEDDTLLTLTTNTTDPKFYFMPKASKEYYEALDKEGYSYISVWIKIDAANAPKVQRCLGNGEKYYNDVEYSLGEWFEIQFPLMGSVDEGSFIMMFDDYKMQSIPGVVFDNYNGENMITIYIDDIYAKKMEDNPNESGEGLFQSDYDTQKSEILIEGEEISNSRKIFGTNVSEEVLLKGDAFANEILKDWVADFQKKGDKMVHVSTFSVIHDTIYMTYYANTMSAEENPDYQRARLAYCPINATTQMTYLDIQMVGEKLGGQYITGVYDTIFAQKDENTLVILWTAKVGEKYYRLYRFFDMETKKLGSVGVNRFKVGDITNDFSTTGIKTALAENEIGVKTMYDDIGIMQKFTTRVENGTTYYYTGAYSGDFNCIIKSSDFITWEYVSQPDFKNLSKWENATYVIGDKCYYFVRQQYESPYGFLTCYDLENDTWEAPVLVADCQSRADFIVYNGELYLFYAPIDREHIGIMRINQDNIAESEIILIADMQFSCFYPYVNYFENGELAMAYTVDRKRIALSTFTLSKYLD